MCGARSGFPPLRRSTRASPQPSLSRWCPRSGHEELSAPDGRAAAGSLEWISGRAASRAATATRELGGDRLSAEEKIQATAHRFFQVLALDDHVEHPVLEQEFRA